MSQNTHDLNTEKTQLQQKTNTKSLYRNKWKDKAWSVPCGAGRVKSLSELRNEEDWYVKLWESGKRKHKDQPEKFQEAVDKYSGNMEDGDTKVKRLGKILKGIGRRIGVMIRRHSRLRKPTSRRSFRSSL